MHSKKPSGRFNGDYVLCKMKGKNIPLKDAITLVVQPHSIGSKAQDETGNRLTGSAGERSKVLNGLTVFFNSVFWYISDLWKNTRLMEIQVFNIVKGEKYLKIL